MKIGLLNQDDYQKRFNEISFLNQFNLDNDLKVKYSEIVLDLAGEIFEVLPPPKKSNKMKSGACYTNSISKLDKGYLYVEGVITNKLTGQKISHAWNINSHGKHVDFTILETYEYLYKGIVIPDYILYEVGLKNGCVFYCCLPYLSFVE